MFNSIATGVYRNPRDMSMNADINTTTITGDGAADEEISEDMP